jgi:hypothetical protein
MPSERTEVTKYKHSVNLDKRISRSSEITADLSNKVPIVILPGAGVDKEKVMKFIMRQETSSAVLMYQIRLQLQLNQTQGLFAYLADGTPLLGEVTVGQLCEAKRDEDGFLYIVAATQEELGCQ